MVCIDLSVYSYHSQYFLFQAHVEPVRLKKYRQGAIQNEFD